MHFFRQWASQMRRKKPHTAPALLAGLWMLISMFDVLQEHDLNALKSLVAKVQLPIPILPQSGIDFPSESEFRQCDF